MPAATTHPVLCPPTLADRLQVVCLKATMVVLQGVLPLKAILWLLDRVPQKREKTVNFRVLARKVSYVQGLKDTRHYNRLVRLNCLKRSLITLYLLRRHGVPARFHLGVNPRKAKFAHAWIERPVTELTPLLARSQRIGSIYATLMVHG